MKTLKINWLAIFIATISFSVLTLSCQKNNSAPGYNPPAGKSTVSIFLVDDPSLVFDNVWLDIAKVEIKVEDSLESKQESEHQSEVEGKDAVGDTSLGWQQVAIHPGVYDILKFRNGLDTLFASTSFSATKGLKKVRVTLGQNNSVVYKGTSFPLSLKGNDNFIVVKIDENAVQVNNGGLTNFWIDIDAGQSIRKHGNSFELKPSVKIFSKEKAGAIEGQVLPQDAAAVVMAINGTDTASAKPEVEGEFKIIGLKPGVYTLVYHATANNYLDSTVNNISISGKDDIKMNPVTLHK